MAEGKELWLFTVRFPFGHGEAFLENELPILARGFARIRLFPLIAEGEARPLPPNVDVVRLFTDDVYRPASWPKVLTKAARTAKVWRTCKAGAPSPAVFRRHRRELLSRLRQALHREDVLHRRMAHAFDPGRVVLYSYWTSDWATVLGLWQLRDPRVRFVSRMMGFDMFDHRAADGWQQFQAFHVAQVDHVYVISQAGLDHMRQRFPQHAGKFSISYLATEDHGPAPWSPSPVLRVVSCSNLVPLKRVHLIAEAVVRAGIPIEWTHFGEGPERPRIEAVLQAAPPNVRVELTGSLPNRDILARYARMPFDVFVHVSETEGGVPVAMQEAASFGIPLLGAEAGGVGEIANDGTGALLPADLTAELLAARLAACPGSPLLDPAFRAGVRAFWKARFEAERVHGRLLDALLTR